MGAERATNVDSELAFVRRDVELNDCTRFRWARRAVNQVIQNDLQLWYERRLWLLLPGVGKYRSQAHRVVCRDLVGIAPSSSISQFERSEKRCQKRMLGGLAGRVTRRGLSHYRQDPIM